MANWYFFDKSDKKIGPISDQAVKALALQGVIRRETVMETADGRTAKAEKVKGLVFAPPSVPVLKPVPLSAIPTVPVPPPAVTLPEIKRLCEIDDLLWDLAKSTMFEIDFTDDTAFEKKEAITESAAENARKLIKEAKALMESVKTKYQLECGKATYKAVEKSIAYHALCAYSNVLHHTNFDYSDIEICSDVGSNVVGVNDMCAQSLLWMDLSALYFDDIKHRYDAYIEIMKLVGNERTWSKEGEKRAKEFHATQIEWLKRIEEKKWWGVDEGRGRVRPWDMKNYDELFEQYKGWLENYRKEKFDYEYFDSLFSVNVESLTKNLKEISFANLAERAEAYKKLRQIQTELEEKNIMPNLHAIYELVEDETMWSESKEIKAKELYAAVQKVIEEYRPHYEMAKRWIGQSNAIRSIYSSFESVQKMSEIHFEEYAQKGREFQALSLDEKIIYKMDKDNKAKIKREEEYQQKVAEEQRHLQAEQSRIQKHRDYEEAERRRQEKEHQRQMEYAAQAQADAAWQQTRELEKQTALAAQSPVESVAQSLMPQTLLGAAVGGIVTGTVAGVVAAKVLKK